MIINNKDNNININKNTNLKIIDNTIKINQINNNNNIEKKEQINLFYWNA